VSRTESFEESWELYDGLDQLFLPETV
jgi:hypothetical protein